MTIAPENPDIEELDFPTPPVENEEKLTADDLYEAVRDIDINTINYLDFVPQQRTVVGPIIFRTEAPPAPSREEIEAERVRRELEQDQRRWDLEQRRREMQRQLDRQYYYRDYQNRTHYCYCSPTRYARLTNEAPRGYGGGGDWSAYRPPGVYADGRQGPTVVAGGGGGGNWLAAEMQRAQIRQEAREAIRDRVREDNYQALLAESNVRMIAHSWLPGDESEELAHDMAAALVADHAYSAEGSWGWPPRWLWGVVGGGVGLALGMLLALLV